MNTESLFHYMQESSEFHKRSFESAVDSIRAIAASHLWQVVLATLVLLSIHQSIFFTCDPYDAACGCACRLEWPPEGPQKLFSFSKR